MHEIALTWYKGQVGLTADVFQGDGSVRETGISLTENATGGLYLGDCASIEAGDNVVYYQDGEYLTGEKYQKVAESPMLERIYKRLFNKSILTPSSLKVYDDDNSTVLSEQEVQVKEGISETVKKAAF